MQINVRSQPTAKLVMNLTCFFISTASNELVTDGLVSYYTFDQANIDGKKLKDVFGDKPETIVGAPKPVPRHLDEAMEFGGSPDCIEFPRILKIVTSQRVKSHSGK